MTVDTTTSGDLVPFDPDQFGDVGLEDVGATDVVIPRLRIVHDEGVFEDNLSKAKFPTLKVVLLGLVKQRIMWHSDVEDDDKPQCKSPDYEHGFPSIDLEKLKRKENLFPWDKSNFKPEDFPPGGATSINGLSTLPCSTCIFKEWEKGDWKQPPCAEQHTFPLLYTPDEGYSWTPALLTLQKTGIKPSRTYISSFAQSKQPMFTVYTELGLTLQSRGTVKYSVPTLKRQEQTSPDQWGVYADTYRSIREFVRQAPRSAEEEDVTPTPTEAAGASAPATAATSGTPSPTASAPAESAPSPAAAATTAPAAAPTAPAASPSPSDEDLPF